MSYDLIVLGGGPGGYLAAERAAQSGLKTVCIEARAFGGVCLNEGCIPSKTLLNSAKIYEYALNGAKYGVTTAGVTIDQKTVVERKNKVVTTLVSGVKSTLRTHKVKMVEGFCEIIGRDKDGFTVSVAGEMFKSTNLIIATGSSPAIPPIPGVKEGIASGFVLTNREILDLETIPQSLVVIGGGVIGLEMAAYYNSVGSKVTVIEMLDHIAGPTDREVSTMLQKVYEKKGVTFKLNSKVTAIGTSSVSYEENGKTETVQADKVLLSIGRRPVISGFGLERLGVLTEKGAIKTDRTCLTSIPNVYAVGDVNGVSMLAHTAYREAEVAVNSIIGKRDIMRYNAIPSVIYTNPEMAGVGETEESAKAKGISYVVGKVSMLYSGRFLAENEGGNGICKILAEKDSGRIIGAHMLGAYVSEFIIAAGMMVETEMTLSDAKEIVFPHPTVSEILREAIFAI
ncbi:MAG: dihydrolipoyl dehydrogenase [Clostridiales bacterium]|nr:dihydrolipoyl dehydrogenase [Clostridiales bacterium]